MGFIYTKSGKLAKRLYFGAVLLFEGLYYTFKNRVLADGGTFVENELPTISQDASLVLTPNAYKVGKLYSAVPNDGTGDFTVDRNSTATYVDEDGLIKTALVNVPRFDYSSGEAALLVEPRSANLYLNSATLATQNITTTANSYTVSFYGTGTITFSGSYSGSLVGTGTGVRVSKTFTATEGTLTSTISGTVTDGQCEKLMHTTSYIPTNGTTETRLLDVIGNSTLNYSGDYTIIFEIDRLFNFITGSTSVLRMTDLIGNILHIYTNGVNPNYNIYLNQDGGYVYGFSLKSSAIGLNKLAISFSNNIIKFYMNGVVIGDTYSTLYRGLSKIDFLSYRTSKSVLSTKAYPTALTDAQLIALTTL